MGVPAYGQQAAGVSNQGQAAASTGGNASTGNNSTNVAANQTTTPTTAPPTVVGSVVGLVLNLTTGSANASTGTSAVTTGAAQASGNNTDNRVAQTDTGTGGGGIVGTVFSPFVTPATVPDQAATVSNGGAATANTGGNTGIGNNSTNVATNNQTVTGGLVNIGLQLGNTASNTSSGTSTINTGPAAAAGNTSTNAVNQVDTTGGPGGPGGRFGGPIFAGTGGPGGPRFGAGGGFACDGFFNFGGQRVNVTNAGTAAATTGNNTSIGNQSTNTATNDITLPGGAVGVNAPGLLGINATNVSDGASAINSGPASASGNQSTIAINQACLEPTPFNRPPSITPQVVRLGPPIVPVRTVVIPGQPVVVQQQLARTGVDPFILGLVAFALLFGGLMFLVWERVEAYPADGIPAT